MINWEHNADVILDYSKMQRSNAEGAEAKTLTRAVSIDKGAELKIICDPFFPLSPGKAVKAVNSYDLIHLGYRNPGIYIFDLQYKQEGGPEGAGWFVLTEQRTTSRRGSGETTERRFRVFFDPGSCCIILDTGEEEEVQVLANRKVKYEVDDDDL